MTRLNALLKSFFKYQQIHGLGGQTFTFVRMFHSAILSHKTLTVQAFFIHGSLTVEQATYCYESWGVPLYKNPPAPLPSLQIVPHLEMIWMKVSAKWINVNVNAYSSLV